MLLRVCASGTAPASGGDIQIGASAAGDGLCTVDERVVDNPNFLNFSMNQREGLNDEVCAIKLAAKYGSQAGSEEGLIGVGRVYVALEGEMPRHGAAVASRLAGPGTSTGSNQPDEVWPEDWRTSVNKRTFRVNARLGTEASN